MFNLNASLGVNLKGSLREINTSPLPSLTSLESDLFRQQDKNSIRISI